MWAFLGSDCMFFGTLISTHLIYRKISATVGGNFLDIRDVFDIELTSFSTFILLASSLFMALAVSAIHKGNLNSTRWMLFGTIILVQFSLLVRSMNLLTSFTLRVTNSLLSSYRGEPHVFGSTFYVLTEPMALMSQLECFGFSVGLLIPLLGK